jgi:hypothetical protein
MSGIQEFNFRFRKKEDDFSSFFSQFEEPVVNEKIEEEPVDDPRVLQQQTKQMDPNRTVAITQSMRDVVGFLLVNKPVDKDAKKQKGIRGFVEYLDFKMGYHTHLTPKEWDGLKEIYRVELNKRKLD